MRPLNKQSPTISEGHKLVIRCVQLVTTALMLFMAVTVAAYLIAHAAYDNWSWDWWLLPTGLDTLGALLGAIAVRNVFFVILPSVCAEQPICMGTNKLYRERSTEYDLSLPEIKEENLVESLGRYCTQLIIGLLILVALNIWLSFY